jgi:hypothetical protein
MKAKRFNLILQRTVPHFKLGVDIHISPSVCTINTQIVFVYVYACLRLVDPRTCGVSPNALAIFALGLVLGRYRQKKLETHPVGPHDFARSKQELLRTCSDDLPAVSSVWRIHLVHIPIFKTGFAWQKLKVIHERNQRPSVRVWAHG